MLTGRIEAASLARESDSSSITSDDVRSWYAKTGNGTPTLRAHCYGLLRTIMGIGIELGSK